MSILRRLFSGGATRPGQTRQLRVTVTFFQQVRDDAVVQVVGEAYRQSSVALARPPGPGQLPPGLPPPPPGLYKALLVTEPTNQYDRNAIAVYLWSGGTYSMVGYLARRTAADYQPVFRHLSSHTEAGPPAISCDAAIIDERGGQGVVLHLGTPGECAAELVTEDRRPAPQHPWMGQAITFTGQLATTIYGVPLDRFAQAMLARWAGCDVLPRVTKKTDAVVVADPNEATANLQKANEYRIPIVQEPDFLSKIGLESEAIGRVSGRWTRG